MAFLARGLFQAAPVGAAPGGDVRPRRPERDPQGGAEVTAERHIRGRIRPQAVVQMRGDDLEAAMPAESGENVEQRHGIGTAGQGGDHPLAGARMPEAPQGLGNAGLESSTPHAEGFLPRGEKWWRCRDLNPGRRGYEPRALTN